MQNQGNVRFPTIREDGTFTVRAWFRTRDDGIVELVRAYVKVWARANRTWVRIWRSNVIEEERLEFDRDFSSAPRVEDKKAQRFAVVFEGRPSSRRWKDWAVRLVDEISTVFPEIKFERFQS